MAGDQFLLMTDALAKWFLLQTERMEKPWRPIGQFFRAEQDTTKGIKDENRNETGGAPPATHFADWVERLRDQGDLRNDDVTLLVIQM